MEERGRSSLQISVFKKALTQLQEEGGGGGGEHTDRLFVLLWCQLIGMERPASLFANGYPCSSSQFLSLASLCLPHLLIADTIRALWGSLAPSQHTKDSYTSANTSEYVKHSHLIGEGGWCQAKKKMCFSEAKCHNVSQCSALKVRWYFACKGLSGKT